MCQTLVLCNRLCKSAGAYTILSHLFQFFGALMRPLEITRVEEEVEYDENDENEDIENGPGVQRNHNPRRTKPLLLRMAEEKRNYLERGSLAGKNCHCWIINTG